MKTTSAKHLKFSLLFLLSLIVSCVSDPSSVQPIVPVPIEGSRAYVLCEGIWGMDNSRIDCYDMEKDSLYENTFSTANPGLHLGDLAYSFARFGDTAFISVTTAGVIYAVRLSDFHSVGMIKLDGDPAPRRIFIQSRTRAYVTNLYDSSVTVFNPTDLTVYPGSIRVGPAPEGICGNSEFVFVANSGYGDYFSTLPLAGTISVINSSTQQVLRNIYCGPNPIELLYNHTNRRLYAVYYHLPSQKDSVGGIVEYSTENFAELRRFRCSAHALAASITGDTLYYLNKEGLFELPLVASGFTSRKIIDNPNKNHNWYSVSVSPVDNSFWIGNSKTYAVKGEILVYARANLTTPKFSFPTGINPNSVLFYRKNT